MNDVSTDAPLLIHGTCEPEFTAVRKEFEDNFRRRKEIGSAVADLVKLARDEQVGLTVVGPEAPLAAGVVDAFRAEGLAIFGPTKAAAQLEASKDFAKRFMARHGIPTAHYATFTDAKAAHEHILMDRMPDRAALLADLLTRPLPGKP